jgi:hypothetical protein
VGSQLESLEWLIRRHHYLANDLCSVSRDVASGKQSYVRSLQHHQGLRLQEATDAALQALDDTTARIVDVVASLRRGQPSDPWIWYVDFLQSCARGNVEVMIQFSTRYRLQ